MSQLYIWVTAFAGGLVGSVFMDIAELNMARAGISSGVTGAHIGRWVHGLAKGKIYHSDMETSPPVANELRIAGVFHYLVGGGVVALAYPVMLGLFDFSHIGWHLPLAMLFGVMTCVLPWFILMPAIGKGLFGRKMPTGSSPIIAPIISHVAYGLGIGIIVLIYSWVMV